jgi:nucleoside-diphosphate-sugar epimerase
MKVFVTGGTGFIGSHLVDRLLGEKTDVYALVRDPQKLKWLEGKNIRCLAGDLYSIPSLPKDLDYVFHVAGLTKSSRLADYYTVNQQGTASLFQSLRSQNITPKRIVNLSTIAAGSPSLEGRPVTEDTPPNPVTCYGKSKLLGEYEAHSCQDVFSTVSIRVGGVYGPRDKDFLSFFKIIKRGFLPLLGRIPLKLSLIHVQDLVTAMMLAARKDLPSGEVFNVADPDPYSWEDLGKTAAEILGKKIKTIKIPLSLVWAAACFASLGQKITGKSSAVNKEKYKEAKQGAWVVDTKKAETLLGFRSQYTLEEGLKETLDWYKEQNWM